MLRSTASPLCAKLGISLDVSLIELMFCTGVYVKSQLVFVDRTSSKPGTAYSYSFEKTSTAKDFELISARDMQFFPLKTSKKSFFPTSFAYPNKKLFAYLKKLSKELKVSSIFIHFVTNKRGNNEKHSDENKNRRSEQQTYIEESFHVLIKIVLTNNVPKALLSDSLEKK